MPTGGWNTGRELSAELNRLLALQRGVVSTAQATCDLTRATLRQLVASGRWQSAHRGVLVAHNGPITSEQRLWVAALAAGAGEPALLGGRTALQVLGLHGFGCDRIHVLIGAARRTRDIPPGVVVHRARNLPAGDTHRAVQPPCTTVARSVVDAASWAGSENEARTVIAMVFQQRLTTLAQIGEVLDRMPRARRSGLVWRTAADADGGAHSLGELDVLRLARAAGLPEPTSQLFRQDAAGRRRYLDLYWEHWQLHVEIDGAHHLDPRQAWQDADRQNQLWVAGDRVLRFPAWLVREQPRKVVAEITRALVAAGWRPERGPKRRSQQPRKSTIDEG